MTQSQNLSLPNLTAFESNKKYSVIYADPPWTFNTWSEEGKEKSADNHYDCMTMDDIRNLPVRNITEDNAICFMWITDPLIPVQIKLMEDWGFEYKTMGFVWTKLNPKSRTPFVGLGYYSRSNEEYCVIGVKGSIGRPRDRSISQSVSDVIREHSRKPDIIRTYIERMYPDANRLEMFARIQYPGWDVFGNQTEKFEPPNTITSFFEED